MARYPYAGVRHAMVTGAAAGVLLAELRAVAGEVWVHFGDSDVISLGSVLARFAEEIGASRVGGGSSGLVRLGGGFDYSVDEIERYVAGYRRPVVAVAPGSLAFATKLTMLVNEADQLFRAIMADGADRMAFFSERTL